jgi:acyl-CoA synthetase (AMP-forming)/AMP-acid ligase II
MINAAKADRMAAPDVASASTLVEVLRAQARTRPDQTAYIFLKDGEVEEARLTFAELDAKARAIAATLVGGGAAVGERALLLYPPGLDFVTAFLGCLFAGVIPVPVIPPRNARSGVKCLAVAKDCAASIAMTTSELLPAYSGWLGQATSIQTTWLGTEVIPMSAADAWVPPAIDGDSIAFLQYTSGSTGTPKGVIVTHSNILANQRAVCLGFGHSQSTVFVGWLPLFHDMGLIGNVLHPLYLGIMSVLLPPLAFLQKPARWLDAITKYRATTSGGPNFGYELCVAEIDDAELARFDLSSWDVAFNGAEPVRADTLERFSAKFERCGFRKSAFFPCYGLAEATLFVSGGPKGDLRTMTVDADGLERAAVRPVTDETARARTFVGCGETWDEQRLRIVDPEACTACEPGAVGEIWLAGPSVTRGYWQRVEETELTFGARLAGSDQRWFRTGDLGFVGDGKLYVTGRLKDLVIIRGRNHYPQDIELTVERCHPALAAAGGATFSVEIEGEERLVVVHEIDFAHRHAVDRPAIERAIRKAIAEEHELTVAVIRLIKPRSIPKTSSGKIRRRSCRDLFLKGQFEDVLDPATATTSAA